MSSPRCSILGVSVDPTDYARATEAVMVAARDKRPYAVSALAVHGVMTGALNPEHRVRLNALSLITPDGQPVRWALNWLHRTRLKDRVYGPFLTRAICERAAAEGLRVFFYGSDVATLDALIKTLRLKWPALIIAGTQASRFRRASEAEWLEDVATLRMAEADIIFCGLGCPRQEIWVYEMSEYVNAPLIAVGAAFPFLAGRLSMAPAWMQRNGLEWVYRLGKEPLRLWRRYLIYNPLFVLGLIAQKLGKPYAMDPKLGDVKPARQRWS